MTHRIIGLCLLAVSILGLMILPSSFVSANHVNSISNPPWSVNESKPNVGDTCKVNSKGIKCAHVHISGFGHLFSRVTSEGINLANTRHNENLSNKNVGDSPVATGNGMFSLSFDVHVQVKGKLISPNVNSTASITYGVHIWKLINGEYKIFKTLRTPTIRECTGCGTQDYDFAVLLRSTLTAEETNGTFKLGSWVKVKALQIPSKQGSSFAQADFSNFDGNNFYVQFTELAICHSGLPCNQVSSSGSNLIIENAIED